MLKYRILSIFLVIILILPAVGCGDKTEDAYISFELPETPSTVDPQTAKTDTELLIVRNVFEGLMRKNGNGEIASGAAESYTKDGLTYTFKIRKNAKWNNGADLTAYDFAFGLRRALNPNTQAPFATRLYSVKNGEKVNKGKLSINKLGIRTINDKTLEIELEKEDDRFLENLTTSVAMPCNEEFFNKSAGKYGLFKDNIICNGSYRLTKWNKESFGIRLYKNNEYDGDFIAKNAAVFLTCNNDEPVTQKLAESHIDIAFIDSAKAPEMQNLGFKTVDCQNICWFLTFSDKFSFNMRKALLKLVGSEVYSSNLKNGYTSADSIFPSVFGIDVGKVGITEYDLKGGKKLYGSEVLKLENNKFPENVILYYYDNGNMKSVVTDIVGHWQSNLSAFVNIEAATSPENLLTELKKQTLSMAIFPVRADSENLAEYLKNFGFSYKNQSLATVQKKLLESKNITPLVFQNTTVCYSPAIKEIYITSSDGFIDFSLVVKDI